MTIPDSTIPGLPVVCPSCSASSPPGAALCGKCGAPLGDPVGSAEATALLGELGRALSGKYVVSEVLGSGRGGITVRARHTASNRDLAVKVAWNDPAARTQVLRETVLTAKVSHPSALAVRDIPAPEPMLVVEMPLADGGTLSDLLAMGKPIPFPQVLEIVRAVGGALDQAHAAGIIHGGLRPIKILLDDAGKPLVSDFEIRIPRRADWDVTRPSEVGAQAYMPLEQRHDSEHIDGRVDQYALAIIAYELLRGQPTWHINDEGVLEIDAIEIMVHRPIAANAPLSASMAIKRATAKDPAFRYPSAGAFVRAFAGEAGEVVAKAHIHRSEIAERERGSRLWLLVPIVLIGAIIGTRQEIRDYAVGAWKGDWSFALGKVTSEPQFSVGSSTDAGSAPPSPSRAESPRAGPSGEPNNTRVGATTPTGPSGNGPAGSNGPAIDIFPRAQPGGSQTQQAGSKRSDPSPQSGAPSVPGSGGSPRKEEPRRSAVGGEISGGAKAADAAAAAAAKAPAGDGALIVTLNANARAVVFVDGRPRGQTPLTLKLSSGSHVVSLRGRDAYSPASTTITVAPGDTSRATFTLGRP